MRFLTIALDPVDPDNKDRLIGSFTDEECYVFFRFRKNQMHRLHQALQLPNMIICDNGTSCSGKHALCFYLFMRTTPTNLRRVQTEFGREMSQLSRIDTAIREWLLVHHPHKVVNNLDWYADRYK